MHDRMPDGKSLRHLWNDAQRRRLISQLAGASRAFAAALPDEEAIDGLIMNLHLCLKLELSPAEMHTVFSARMLTFLAGLLAASHSEGLAPHYVLDPEASLLGRRPLAHTQIGAIDANGDLRAAPPANGDGAVRLVFRGRAP